MEIRPYLIFKGECQDAIKLYERTFDSKITDVMRFSDMPESSDDTMSIPDDKNDWIVMSKLPMGDSFIRLSDTIGELKDAVSERVTIAVETEVDMIKKYVHDYTKAKFFITGPEVMVLSMFDSLIDSGVAEENIFKEDFPGY